MSGPIDCPANGLWGGEEFAVLSLVLRAMFALVFGLGRHAIFQFARSNYQRRLRLDVYTGSVDRAAACAPERDVFRSAFAPATQASRPHERRKFNQAGVLYPTFESLLSPIVAAAAMALSSVSAVGNALRLRQYAFKRTSPTNWSNAFPAAPSSSPSDEITRQYSVKARVHSAS